MQKKSVIFIGKSGSGKGTQAKMLVPYLEENDPDTNVVTISSGGLLREFMETGTYTANKVKAILDEGGLIEVFIPIRAWAGCLNENIKDNTEHLVFEGIARLEEEAHVLSGVFEFYERDVVDIVVLDLPDEVATERLKGRGRYDDNDEDIKARLAWYEENTTRSIKYFQSRERYRVHVVDASRSKEEVFKEIIEALEL